MDETGRKIVTAQDLERRHIVEHVKPYYDWIRHVVTLSLGALTALVALQGHYVPAQPVLPAALAIAWIGLLATLALGQFALRGEYLTRLQAAARIRRRRETYGEAAATQFAATDGGTLPSRAHAICVQWMLAMFLVSLSSLCTFAIANLGLL